MSTTVRHDLHESFPAHYRADAPRRTGPGGRTAEVTDHVLLIRRTA